MMTLLQNDNISERVVKGGDNAYQKIRGKSAYNYKPIS